ncbi:hypothetical protein NBRC116583_05150 [Arenicella sp. 4NH20-0111]
MEVVENMKITRVILLLFVFSFIQACSSTNKTVSYEWNQSKDPLEGLNRSIYSFNTTADRLVLRPIAKGYDAVLPKPAKTGVSNFFSNLGEPISAVNNLLQGKVDRALGNTYRFVVNSTIGVLGLFDVAKHQGVNKTPEDLGQTLAVWGVKPGPYLMLPFLGPTNLRDGIGRSVSSAVYYPINEISDNGGTRLGLTALDLVDSRAKLLGIDSALEKQLDPYIFIKTTVENGRTDSINDGKVIEEEFDF